MSLTGTLFGFLTANIQSVLIFLILFLVLWHYYNLPSNLPPGPPNLPLIGSLPFLRLPLHSRFTDWKKKYGDVVSMYLGGQLVVVLNSFEVMKEAYIKKGDVSSGRMQFDLLKEHGDDKAGVLNTEGSYWKEQRRFTISSLRDFGMGKHSLEYKIQEEIEAFTSELKKQNGSAMDLHLLMNMTISNIICSIMFGDRFSYDDPEFIRMLGILNTMMEGAPNMIISEKLPILRHLPGDPVQYHWVNNCFIKDTKAWIGDFLSNHRKLFDPDHQKDFIDAYLAQTAANERSGKESHLSDKTLYRTILDLFIAGTETTSTTLRWAVLYMMLLPEVQRKVQSEIDEVVGRERLPSLKDRSSMPYTEAVIQELTRIQPIAPIGVPHRATEEFVLNDFTIPKGTVIMGNTFAVHRDPGIFDNPSEFRPERFLSEDGTKVLKSDFLIPFGVGRRICAGESLARMELFLFFTAMLQRFSFKLPAGAPRPDPEKPIAAMTLSPPKYKMCALLRHD